MPLAVLAFAVLTHACVPDATPIGSTGFETSFSAPTIDRSLWHSTGGPYVQVGGGLEVKGAYNRPLWLRRPLPRDVELTFFATSFSDAGDIKVELFGDGESFAKRRSYRASGYVLIFGGWQNRLNVIARLDEHGADRVEGPVKPVVPGHRYAIRIRREGNTLSWFADDALLGRLVDPKPLWGRKNRFFAFNNWEARVRFEDLRVVPLPTANNTLARGKD